MPSALQLLFFMLRGNQVHQIFFIPVCNFLQLHFSTFLPAGPKSRAVNNYTSVCRISCQVHFNSRFTAAQIPSASNNLIPVRILSCQVQFSTRFIAAPKSSESNIFTSVCIFSCQVHFGIYPLAAPKFNASNIVKPVCIFSRQVHFRCYSPCCIEIKCIKYFSTCKHIFLRSDIRHLPFLLRGNQVYIPRCICIYKSSINIIKPIDKFSS